jgi:tetratricopeptide (TPR) repeat protein
MMLHPLTPTRRPVCGPIESMNTALRTTVWSITAALGIAGAASAQKDRIVLTDGSVIDGVQVTSFDLRNVEFKRRGTSESKSTDQVASLEVQKVKDAFRRAYSSIGTNEAPGNFLQEAERQSDVFLKQFGYQEAARLFLKNGQYAEAFQVLEELASKCPDSGFLPMTHQAKLDYYLSQGKAKAGDASTVAKRYSLAASTQGYPQGFILESRFYETMAQAAAGGLTPDRLRSTLRSIQNEAGAYPNVSNRCRVQIAETLRAENKVDEARSEFEGLLERDGISQAVQAQAWLGLGNCQFAAGTPSNREPFRDALLSFLRIVVESDGADASTVAEALYMGAQAADKWGGEDAGRMGRVLRGRLKRDYPDSEFARR